MLFSYIKYIIKRGLMFVIIGAVALVGIAYGINKIIGENNKEQVTIQETTDKQASLEHKSNDEINQERQNQFNREDKERLEAREAHDKAHSRDNSKASDIWTDDNGKNVVQPHIDEEQQKIKNHDKDAVCTNPTASGKSFLGDDIK